MRKTRIGSTAAIAVAFTALLAPAAQAAPCDGKGVEQPFLGWNDRALYALVDGGDFETGAPGWELTGDAGLAAGGNPLRPSSSSTSLSLPSGSSATTPAICVAKFNPTARIFARTTTPGAKRTTLKVQVLYLNADGTVRKVKKAGTLRNEPTWDATRKFSLAQGQFNAKPDQTGSAASDPKPGNGNQPNGHSGASDSTSDYASIQLRFTPRFGAEWQIDDVFVDPRRYR